MADRVTTNQAILVVGGGISGMTAAIEKRPFMGGRAFRPVVWKLTSGE